MNNIKADIQEALKTDLKKFIVVYREEGMTKDLFWSIEAKGIDFVEEVFWKTHDVLCDIISVIEVKQARVSFFIASYPAEEQDEQPHKEVLALLLDSKLGNMYDCYTSTEQHTICSQSFINDRCKKASPEQYKELQKEMENLGYNLEIIN